MIFFSVKVDDKEHSTPGVIILLYGIVIGWLITRVGNGLCGVDQEQKKDKFGYYTDSVKTLRDGFFENCLYLIFGIKGFKGKIYPAGQSS